jgi:hypothetical protein
MPDKTPEELAIEETNRRKSLITHLMSTPMWEVIKTIAKEYSEVREKLKPDPINQENVFLFAKYKGNAEGVKQLIFIIENYNSEVQEKK